MIYLNFIRSLKLWPILGWILIIFLIISIARITSREKQFTGDVNKALKLAEEWILNNQNERGDFKYIIKTKDGSQNKNDYNIVREAGGIYSLSQVYRQFKNPKSKEALEKGVGYFRKLYKKQKSGSLAISYDKARKSNTTALYLLGMIEMIESDKDLEKKYTTETLKLADFLIETQYENGGFDNQLYGKEEESDYNNGETFYALIRMYKWSKEARYLSAVKKAAPYLMNKYPPSTLNRAYFAWGMEGFAHLYEVEPKKDYWQYMKEYTETFLKTEKLRITSENKNDFRGAFGVYLEGLAHVAWIAKKNNIIFYINLKNIIENTLNKTMTIQASGPLGIVSTTINNVKGGFCDNLECKTQRIDTTQHNISAMYWYLNMVR